MKNTSLNGLVTEKTVNDLYELALDNARAYVNHKAKADVKAMSSKGNNPKKGGDQQGTTKGGCYQCGSVDHWARDCPKKDRTNDQSYSSGSKAQSSTEKGKSSSKGSQSTKGKGKTKAVKKYTYAVIGGKPMRQRYKPMAKECFDWEPDADVDADEIEQQDGEQQEEVPDNAEEHEQEQP